MSLLLKPIRYVFYRTLASKLRDATEITPVLVACTSTSLFLGLNVLLVYMLVNCVWQGEPFPQGYNSNLLYPLIVASFLALNRMMTFAWVVDGKFDNLRREFAGGDPHRKSVRSILFWTYVVFSGAAPIVLAILWHKRHN
jgi:hypothetical protein